jgi:hypothetical protein
MHALCIIFGIIGLVLLVKSVEENKEKNRQAEEDEDEDNE